MILPSFATTAASATGAAPVPSTRRPFAIKRDPSAVFMVAGLVYRLDSACRVPLRCTYLQDRPNRESRAIGDRRIPELRALTARLHSIPGHHS